MMEHLLHFFLNDYFYQEIPAVRLLLVSKCFIKGSHAEKCESCVGVVQIGCRTPVDGSRFGWANIDSVKTR